MLQRRLLVSLAALSALLSSCAHGPRVNYCVLDGSVSARAQCSDGVTQTGMLNWACLSPADVRTMLGACRKYRPALTYCIVSDHALACSDPELSQRWVPFTEASGYSCLSPMDTGRLMRYCRFEQ